MYKKAKRLEHLMFIVLNPRHRHVKIPVGLYIEIQPHNELQA